MLGLTWIIGVGLTAAAVYFLFFVGIGGGGNNDEEPVTAARPPQDIAAVATRTPVPTATPRAVLPPNDVRVSVAYEPRFIWPALGDLTSTMSPEHPNGIDIGLKTSEDSPIYAAAEGRVVFAGGDDSHEYGFHIILDHGNAVTTMYAHLSEIWIKQDEVVGQGKVIGLGGDTGFADGKHLHFEVKGKEGGIDPLHVLPEIDETGRTAASNLSCDGKAIPLDRGASAVIDFQSALLATESITRAEFVDPGSSVTLAAFAQTRSRVKVASTIDLSSNFEQSFELAVTIRGAGDATRTGKCVVTVTTTRVAPSFYVRVARPGDPSAEPTAVIIACHPSYSGGTDTGSKGCIRTNVGDYDCFGAGDGPNFVSGKVRIIGGDPFGLDGNRDGIGCDGSLDW